MALFKILSNMTDTSKQLPLNYHQGYCYFDVNTGKFWIDTTDTAAGRMAINAYKADIATLANAAVYETTEAVNAPLHKINTYYGHGLSLEGTTLSLVAGDNSTTLSSITLGAGLTSGDINGTSIIKAKLKTETAFIADSAAQTNTASRQYMVGVDKSGYLSVNVPWINTNTKVTSVENHYAPITNEYAVLTANASGAAAEWSIDVVKGITINRDAKGHVTGVSVTSGKIPANPNTNYYHKTGSWSGLTYTAGKVGSPDDLVFTIPTGTTATTVALGNHTHATSLAADTGTSSITLAHGGKYKLTTGGTSVIFTMPSNSNTDYKVRQTNDTSNTNYRLLLSNSANSTQEDNITHKNDNLIYNPSTMTLSTGNLNLTGELNVVGNTYLHNETQADNLTASSLLVTGNANFTQIPTAPTPASGSNDTSIATTAFVMNAFTANDAMVFKGVVNKNADLPTTHKQGWTYKVGTAGQYADVNCEVGDTIYCITDGTSANNAHWAVVQANVDVPLYKDGNTFAGSKVLMSDGTGGKVKEGTIATQTVIKTATLSQGTLPTLGTAIAADDITAWDAGSVPTLGTAFSVPNVTGNTSVTASKVTKTEVTVVTNISQAASTSSVIATVADGVLTIAKAITAVGAVTKNIGTANTVDISDVSASKVTLGTAFSIPNVTGVGSAPSLSYTARTIPNVTGVGTLPSLSTTTQSVVTGIS